MGLKKNQEIKENKMFKLVVLLGLLACAFSAPVDFDKDVLQNNASRFDFNLTMEEMMEFEGLVFEVKRHLYDNKRIFEVARALAQDESLRNEVMDVLKEAVGPNPKEGIYQAFVFFVDKLEATSNSSSPFNFTEEEHMRFDQTYNYIFSQLFGENRRFFMAVRAFATDKDLQREAHDAIKEILHGENPKQAVFDLLNGVQSKLEQVEDSDDVFFMDEEEEKKFDRLLNAIKTELVDNRRIYEALKAFVLDGRLRDDVIEHVLNIFVGDEPKKSLFDGLNALHKLLNE